MSELIFQVEEAPEGGFEAHHVTIRPSAPRYRRAGGGGYT